MAKFKPIRAKKGGKGPAGTSAPGVVSCLFVLVLLFGLLGVVLYFAFKSG
jgi:hypothetical protein